jgi:hypothetical protein
VRHSTFTKLQLMMNNQALVPQDYLDKYAITTYFKDVITLVLENRPEDPLEFMAD